MKDAPTIYTAPTATMKIGEIEVSTPTDGLTDAKVIGRLRKQMELALSFRGALRPEPEPMPGNLIPLNRRGK